MWRKFYLAFVVAAIGGTILSITEVDARSTLHDSASCEPSTCTLEEAVKNLIKQELNKVGLSSEDGKAVNLTGEDVNGVKNLLGLDHQRNNATCITEKHLEDFAVCASNQQRDNASSSLDEAVKFMRKYLAEVQRLLESNQQQNNASSMKDNMEDLKAVFVASTQQQKNVSSSINEAVNLISEDLANVKNVLASIQQQNNATCISKHDVEDLKTACASNQQQCRQTVLSKQDAASLLLCEYKILDLTLMSAGFDLGVSYLR